MRNKIGQDIFLGGCILKGRAEHKLIFDKGITWGKGKIMRHHMRIRHFYLFRKRKTHQAGFEQSP